MYDFFSAGRDCCKEIASKSIHGMPAIVLAIAYLIAFLMFLAWSKWRGNSLKMTASIVFGLSFLLFHALSVLTGS
jgi:predicted membrane channel-forming protein YqfA (hemolysin III family)